MVFNETSFILCCAANLYFFIQDSYNNRLQIIIILFSILNQSDSTIIILSERYL